MTAADPGPLAERASRRRHGRPARSRGAWLFPATYVVHLGEEYFVAGGFPLWAQRTLAVPLSTAEFVAWNALGLALMCLGAWLVSRDSTFRFIDIALSTGVLGNAVAHLCGSLLTWTYSPGLVTGVVIWLPLSAVRLRHALPGSPRRTRIAGVSIGVCVTLVTIAVIALGAVFR